MKRRDFLTTIGLGAIAAGSFPGLALGKEKQTQETLVYTRKASEPVKETYTLADRVRSGIAHGGIGAGSVELRKNGQFYNWSIFNNTPLGTGPAFELKSRPRNGWEESLMFFLVRYEVPGQAVKIKLLQLNQTLDEAGMESIDYYFPWITAVEKIEYSARFPYTWLRFTDSEMPFDVDLEVFSPFIPHDVKNSSLPGVYFNFKITPHKGSKAKVSLIASQRNLVSYDTINKYFVAELTEKPGCKFFTHTAGGADTASACFGTMGIASCSDDTSWYLGWEHRHPYYERLLVEDTFPNLNDVEGRNKTDKAGIKRGNMGFREKDQRCFSSLGISRNLENGPVEHTFVMTWNFPNAYGSHNAPDFDMQKFLESEKNYADGQKITKNQGHYYSNYFPDAAAVAFYMAANRKELSAKTARFLKDYYASDIDVFVLDQINSQLNTFISSSTLTKSGAFAIREGMTPDKSWGPNATIDVSLYGSFAIVCLFPELQKSMMRCHKALQTPTGEINHGLGFDLDFTQNGTWGVYHRIDMPGNYIQLVLRDFFWTGDLDYLKEMWPSIIKAIDYVLNERDKDKDLMPDMEGIMCSYDNFPMYGLASYIQSQWIAAMAGAIKAARILKDSATEQKCRKIYDQGVALMEKHLWNGEYYRLANDYNGEKGVDEGCLTDQIIGQWLAHQSGLGYLFDKEKVKKSLASVLKYSFREGFGLRNCTWPEFPERYPIHTSDLWVDQANTPWSGVELAFASFLIYEGMVEEGYKIIKAVDDRYRRANLYFDHQEFGGHYYRPMAAWGILNALLGLYIDNGTFAFAPKLTQGTYTMFFAFNNGTAHYAKTNNQVKISILSGEWHSVAIRIADKSLNWTKPEVSMNGKKLKYSVSVQNDEWVIVFKQPLIAGENDTLTIG